MRWTAEAMHQMPAVAFIEQPRSDARTIEQPHTVEIDAAFTHPAQHLRGVIAPGDADAAHPVIPQPRAECGIQHGAAGLRHPRRPIVPDEIVHEQIADDDE